MSNHSFSDITRHMVLISRQLVIINVGLHSLMGDQEAMTQIGVGDLIEKLPGFNCVIGDCAYTPLAHWFPSFVQNKLLLLEMTASILLTANFVFELKWLLS
jgi:hypothetical protein